MSLITNNYKSVIIGFLGYSFDGIEGMNLQLVEDVLEGTNLGGGSSGRQIFCSLDEWKKATVPPDLNFLKPYVVEFQPITRTSQKKEVLCVQKIIGFSPFEYGKAHVEYKKTISAVPPAVT